MNGTLRLLMYTDCANLLGERMQTNAEALLVPREEVGLEVYSE